VNHKKREAISFTPGFSAVTPGEDRRKPFKRFLVRAATIAGLKPGVNETGSR